MSVERARCGISNLIRQHMCVVHYLTPPSVKKGLSAERARQRTYLVYLTDSRWDVFDPCFDFDSASSVFVNIQHTNLCRQRCFCSELCWLSTLPSRTPQYEKLPSMMVWKQYSCSLFVTVSSTVLLCLQPYMYITIAHRCQDCRYAFVVVVLFCCYSELEFHLQSPQWLSIDLDVDPRIWTCSEKPLKEVAFGR